MWRRRFVPTRILLLFLTLGLAVGAPGLTPGVTMSGAAETPAGATSTQTLRAIACPSVTICYAVGDGGTILATHDAGATWQQQTSGTHDQVDRIACPAASACFAITPPVGCGGPNASRIPLLRTTDGGTSWTRTTIPPNCPGPGLSCPSVTTCYVFGSCYAKPGACPKGSGEPGNPELYRTTDGGNGWRARGKTPDNKTSGNWTQGIGVQSLACPTTSICYAGGLDQLAESTDGGKRWTRQFIYVAPCPTAEIYCHQLNLMTCPGQRICYAGGTSIWGTANPFDQQNVTGVVVATTNAFRTWRRTVIRSFHGLVALSCPTPTHCFALGGGHGPFSHDIGSINETGRVAATTDGGTTWRVERIARYPFTAVACPSISVCYAAGYLGRVMKSTDGGKTWRDLTQALFVSGAYGNSQPLHTYSSWFTATAPWRVTANVMWEGQQGPDGNPLGCLSTASATPAVYVLNGQGQTVAGPVPVQVSPQTGEDATGTSPIQVTGKLRLDVVSHCSTFSVRVDGVRQSQGYYYSDG